MSMDWRDLSGDMPPRLIEQALDDDGDGIADAAAWESVKAAVEIRLRGCFGGDIPARHTAVADGARRVFLLETLYTRRGFTENNPYTARAATEEKRLKALAAGEDSTEADSGAAFIGSPAKVAGTKGLMA
jgi:hypothetical protein